MTRPPAAPPDALRRQLVLLVLLVPALCPLTLLAIIAPAGPVRWLLMAGTLLAGLGLGWLLLRAYRRLLALADERQQGQSTHPD